MNTETAEHQKDLDELCRMKNARDELAKELSREKSAHTALKQIIREHLGADQEGEPESVIVATAGAALRRRAPTENALPIPLAKPVREGTMSDDELDEEMQRIDESRPLSFRDHAFLQSLAGSAIRVAKGALLSQNPATRARAACAPDVDGVVDAAYEIAKQADRARDW